MGGDVPTQRVQLLLPRGGLSESTVRHRGLTVVSGQGRMSIETLETGVAKRTGEIRTAPVTGIHITDAAGKPLTFRTDPGFNHAPGFGLADMLKRNQAS